MKRLFMILLALLIIIPSQSGAQIPRTISYQGVLADSVSGNAMHGEFDFVFKLFDAEVGGVQIWKSDVKALTITKGLFSTGLGPFGPEVKFDKPYWLDIEAAGKLLSPRIPLTSVAYSMNSMRADTAMVSITSVGDTTWQTNGSDIYYGRGKVGIGTASPTEKLSVFGGLTVTGGNVTIGTTARMASRLNIFGPSPQITIRDSHAGVNQKIGVEGDGLSLFYDQGKALTVIRASGKVGIGTTDPASILDVNGTTTTKVLAITGGSDLAEPFEISDNSEPAPGTVVVIDPENPGKLKQATEPYDKRVAGVISGAGGIKSGLRLSQEGLFDKGQDVALTGKVYALATTENGVIQPGDLLTTSSMPGHAMKATDHERSFGAVIGKAMSRLSEGEGLVLVLIQPH